MTDRPAVEDLAVDCGGSRRVGATISNALNRRPDVWQRYDLIIDLGGTRTLSELRRSLAPRGTLVLVGGEDGGRWVGGGMLRSLRALMLSPFVRQRLRMIFARAKTEDLRFLKELIETGEVTPVLDQTYSLSGAADAIDHLHAGRARGKLIITP